MLLVQHKQRLVKRTKPFTLKNGELYRMGQGKRLMMFENYRSIEMMRELHEGPS
jgi:hypothetical protein